MRTESPFDFSNQLLVKQQTINIHSKMSKGISKLFENFVNGVKKEYELLNQKTTKVAEIKRLTHRKSPIKVKAVQEKVKPNKELNLKSSNKVKTIQKVDKSTKKTDVQSKGTKFTKPMIGNGSKIGKKMKLQLPTNACKTCGKRFKDQYGAKRHQMYVHDKTLWYNNDTKMYFFHCNFCKTEFRKQTDFESHLCEEKPLKIEKFQLVKKKEVKKNLTKLTEDKLFKMPTKMECSECNMEFQSEQKMKSHLAKYHFKCQFCPRIFDIQWFLYDHEETTHGIKKFDQCSYCPQKFTSKEYLHRHCKFEHKIDTKLCICFTTDFKTELLKHWDQMTKSAVPEPSVEYVPPEVYEVEQFCGICDFSTKIYSELETHVLNHPDEIE